MSKEIFLTNGGSTTIDDEDYDYLMQWNWQSNRNTGVYRCTSENGIRKIILMHRVIAERMRLNTEGLQIDHKDRNPFNNQRSNLRVATNSQNNMNRDKNENNTSGYKGVWWDEQSSKWRARIVKDDRKYYLGYFDDPIEAAKAYDQKARELFGRFAVLNFPDEPDLTPYIITTGRKYYGCTNLNKE